MTEKERLEIEQLSLKAHEVLNFVKTQIRKAREEVGFSQETVARLMGMSHSGFAKIESGENDITLTRLVQISEVLKSSITDFLPKKESGGIHQIRAKKIDSVVTDVNIMTQYNHVKDDNLQIYLQQLENRLKTIEEYLY